MRSIERDQVPDSLIGRVVIILDTLRSGDAVGISELARRTGLPKSTTHRLVAELRQYDLVETTGSQVRLGLHLFELGQSVPRQRSLREAALPLMLDLHEATGKTVHLAVPDGTEVVYVEILHGPDTPKLPSRVGGRMPAYCTGVGKAILAFSPPEVTDAVLAGGLARRSPHTVVVPGLLLKELARIRETGVSYDREESGPGIVCCASPVFGSSGEPVAAVSITGWSTRLDLDRAAPAVRTMALALSRQLGWRKR